MITSRKLSRARPIIAPTWLVHTSSPPNSWNHHVHLSLQCRNLFNSPFYIISSSQVINPILHASLLQAVISQPSVMPANPSSSLPRNIIIEFITTPYLFAGPVLVPVAVNTRLLSVGEMREAVTTLRISTRFFAAHNATGVAYSSE